MSHTKERLASLRNILQSNHCEAWIIPTADPHLSEYLPNHWSFREWLSGFNGSAGTLVVSQTKAALWTDSRYWEQARIALAHSSIELMKSGVTETPSIAQWLAQHVPTASSIGFAAELISVQSANTLIEELKAVQLIAQPSQDISDAIWNTDRPEIPREPVFEMQKPALSRQEKLTQVRMQLKKLGANATLLSDLSSIAWLTNLRGCHIEYNPVFLSYAYICADQAILFIDPACLTQSIRSALEADTWQTAPYNELNAFLAEIPSQQVVLLDNERTTLAVQNAFNKNASLIRHTDPVTLLKSRKTPQEIVNIKEAMIEDGIALVHFYAWLDSALKTQPTLTEGDLAKRLHDERAKGATFIEESFETICAFGRNAALPHYSAPANGGALIKGNGLLLIDSGGHYQGGTTDITRMSAIGQPTVMMKNDCTRVLQGMIALALARFPDGVYGAQLDTLARLPLWKAGLDFGHGTGHGVGYCLNVHEAPVSISPRATGKPEAQLHPGHVFSDEPGVYRPGRWGVRIENLLYVRPFISPKKDAPSFCELEILTLCPIDLRCINTQLLTYEEISWLNDYHHLVLSTLLPHTQGDTAQWLREACRPIPNNLAQTSIR